jgi:hypothetical protein
MIAVDSEQKKNVRSDVMMMQWVKTAVMDKVQQAEITKESNKTGIEGGSEETETTLVQTTYRIS